MAAWRHRRSVRIAVAAAAALLLYAATGFLLAPRLLRGPLERETAARLGRDISLGRLRLNPFRIAMTAERLGIRDPDGTPLVAWERLHVDFDPLRSLWRREWAFREIHLTGATGRLALLPGGALNIDDIIARLSAATPGAAPAGPPPVVSVGRLRIEDTSVSFVDRSGDTPFTTTLGPLRIDLREFTTRRGEDNAYTFQGATEAGETFSWSGRFELDPLRSEGEFSLGNVTLAKYHPYYRGVVPFDIRGGTGDLSSRYRFAWGTSERALALTGASAAIRDLKLSEHEKEEIALETPVAEVQQGEMDLLTGAVSIGRFATQGGRLLLKKSKEGRVNLLDMILPFFEEPAAGGASGAPSGAASAPPPTAPPAAPIRIGELTFADYTVETEDLSPPRPVRVRLDQIALTLRGVDNVPGTTAKGSLDLRWNGSGTVHADGDLSLVGLNGKLKVAIAGLDVRPVEPYVEPALDLRVTKGTFFADGDFQVSLLDTEHPRVSFQGNVRMDDFATIDGRDREEFLRWGSVRLDRIDYSLERDRMRIGDLTIAGGRAALIVAPDGTINLARVLRLPPPVPVAEEGADAATGTAGEAGSAEAGSLPPAAAAPAFTPPAETASGAPAAPGAPAAVAADGGDTRIARARLRDGQIRLIDRSMTPAAELLLDHIDGTLAGLSSRPGARADVHLMGIVGETAPLSLDGQVDPLGAEVFSDLVLTAEGIDLAPLGPYSARYVGYELDRAKLSLDLRYRLESRAVTGANVFTADPFLLGGKTDSPDATKLPVRLGLALLRDRHGVIKLDVPVEGSLDDPKFRLGRVILRALVNVFTKLVTAPFTLLARAFAGRDDIDLSLIEFAPGSAAIAEGERPRLETLVKGLTDRPGLSLAITGRVAPDPGGAGSDFDALRRAELDGLVRAAKWKSLRRAARDATPVESVVVEPGETPRFLKAAWKEFLEAHPDATGDSKPETPDEIEARLLPRLEVGAEDFTALAAARAGAVRDHLVAAGIETARLEVKTEPAGGAKVTLELQ